MKLYHRPDCPFCWKVKLYLSEIGVEVEEVLVELGKTHPEVTALNPNATVPVMLNEGLVLYESAIIIEYLADKFPEKTLITGTPEQQAKIRQLHLFSDSKLGKVIFPFIKKVREGADATEIEKLKTLVADDWIALQKNLCEQLGRNEYFFGNFSAADCAVIPRISTALAYGLVIEKEYNNLSDWLERCMRRPSFMLANPGGFQIIDEMVKSALNKV